MMSDTTADDACNLQRKLDYLGSVLLPDPFVTKDEESATMAYSFLCADPLTIPDVKTVVNIWHETRGEHLEEEDLTEAPVRFAGYRKGTSNSVLILESTESGLCPLCKREEPKGTSRWMFFTPHWDVACFYICSRGDSANDVGCWDDLGPIESDEIAALPIGNWPCRRAKTGVPHIIAPKPSPYKATYDARDKYYLDDYYRETVDHAFQATSKEQALINARAHLIPRLLRIFRVQSTQKPTVIAKESSEYPFSMRRVSIPQLVKDNAHRMCTLVYKKVVKGKDVQTEEKYNVLAPLDDMVFAFSELHCIPYVNGTPDPVLKRYGANALNTFCGYKARRVPLVRMSLIEPLLAHIRDVWASGNEEHYRYILSWLAEPIRNPGGRTEVALVLIGKQGTGKTTVAEFMMEYVYGRHLSYTTDGFSRLTQRFNSALTGKMFICVEEPECADSRADYINTFNAMKTKITNALIDVEAKGEKPIAVENVGNYVVCTNNDVPVRLEDRDRRYAVFRVSDKYIQSREYFGELRARCFNEEVGNHFLTYLYSLPDEVRVSLFPVPETKERTLIQDTSRSKAEQFREALVKSEQIVPAEFLIRVNENVFIPSTKLLEVAELWEPGCKLSPQALGKGFRKTEEFQEIRLQSKVHRGRGYYISESVWDMVIVVKRSHLGKDEELTLREWMEK